MPKDGSARRGSLPGMRPHQLPRNGCAGGGEEEGIHASVIHWLGVMLTTGPVSQLTGTHFPPVVDKTRSTCGCVCRLQLVIRTESSEVLVPREPVNAVEVFDLTDVVIVFEVAKTRIDSKTRRRNRSPFRRGIPKLKRGLDSLILGPCSATGSVPLSNSNVLSSSR